MLTVLDFQNAEVNFYPVTKKESQDIEKTLDGLSYDLSNIEYMVAELNLIDSNISDVQDYFQSISESEEN